MLEPCLKVSSHLALHRMSRGLNSWKRGLLFVLCLAQRDHHDKKLNITLNFMFLKMQVELGVSVLFSYVLGVSHLS